MLSKSQKINFLLLVVCILILPNIAHAVIPPDFIFNIGTQIVQFFSLICLFSLAVFGAFLQFFKMGYQALRHKKAWLVGVILLIVLVSGGAAYFYAIREQKLEYQKWLEESKKNENSENIQEKSGFESGGGRIRKRVWMKTINCILEAVRIQVSMYRMNVLFLE